MNNEMESSSGKKCCCVYAGKRSDQSRIMERIRSCIHKRISAQFDRQGPRCLSLCSVNIASMCTRISNFSIRHCTCEPHLQVKEMRMRIIIGEQKKPERTVRQTDHGHGHLSVYFTSECVHQNRSMEK